MIALFGADDAEIVPRAGEGFLQVNGLLIGIARGIEIAELVETHAQIEPRLRLAPAR